MASEKFGDAARPTPQQKKAIILTETNTDPVVLRETIDHLEKYSYSVTLLPNTPENKLAAVEKARLGPRERSVCYIAGSGKGNDPELIEKVGDLVRTIAEAGYNTVCPGAEGMMGVITEEVRKLGKLVTSVFSLAVAQANVEKLYPDSFDCIVVAPDEDTRQEFYHLLSGAQIALPGGGGTTAEAAAHFYKNTQIGLVYPRKPDGVINYPSPIIYFSPSTKETQQAAKEILCKYIYPNDPDMQKKIRESAPPQGGYWGPQAAQYDMEVAIGFLKPEYRNGFIETLRTPKDVVDMLENWSDPDVRQLMVTTMNIHNKTGQRFLKIMRSHELKPGG